MNSRILILVTSDTLGGAEQYLKMIAEYFLKQKKIFVHVFFLKSKNTGYWEDLKKYQNVQINYMKTNSEKKGVFLLTKYLFKIRMLQFDYVFTSHIHLNAYSGILKKVNIIKTSVLISRESTVVFSRFKGYKLMFFKICYLLGYSSIDLLICQSKDMKSQLLKKLPWLQHKILVKVIDNPVNIPIISDNSNNDNIFSDKYIVSAGRLIEEKGFDLLIEAFKIVQKKYKNLRLVILGIGKLKEDLDTQIMLSNLENKVILKGFVRNVYPYFKNAEACVVSSRIEGFPNVLLQMMSQNNSVISTLCADGINELKGVEIAQVNDVKSLSNAILKSLSQNSSNNRNRFDKEIESRSINLFIKKIGNYISRKI